MDIALPSFILGYHGCDQQTAEKIFLGQATLQPSRNEYDWLADGIYFWEHNPQRAYDFAVDVARSPHPSEQKIKHPAVVGAIIDLGHCLNLLDSRFIEMVKQAHVVLAKVASESGMKLPTNVGGIDRVARRLDCAVIRALHENRKENGKLPFDAVRAAFFEGAPLYDNAGFAAKNHIQVCVRDHRSIIGYFRPLNEEGKPLVFK